MSDTDNTNDIPNPFISSPFYDRMKFFVLVALPAFGSLYFGLGNALGLPAIEQVVGSVSVVGVFLGTILGVSSSQYKNIARRQAKVEQKVADQAAFAAAEAKVAGYIGTSGPDPDTGIPGLTLTVTKDPNEILAADEITLKVGQAPPPTQAVPPQA